MLRLVAAIHIGKKVDVKIIRGGRVNIFPVVVTERKESKELAAGKGVVPGGYFGMTVQNITPQLAERMRLAEKTGVVVTGVREGSPAQEAGVKARDIILQVNKAKIASLKDFKREMSKKEAKRAVLLLVKRGKSAKYIAIQGS